MKCILYLGLFPYRLRFSVSNVESITASVIPLHRELTANINDIVPNKEAFFIECRLKIFKKKNECVYYNLFDMYVLDACTVFILNLIKSGISHTNFYHIIDNAKMNKQCHELVSLMIYS